MTHPHLHTDWITDPAVIELIVKFGGLQVGDEVRAHRCHEFSIPYHYEGQVGRVIDALHDTYNSNAEREWVTSPLAHSRAAAEVDFFPPDALSQYYADRLRVHRWYVALWNIAAWRRPLQQENAQTNREIQHA